MTYSPLATASASSPASASPTTASVPAPTTDVCIPWRPQPDRIAAFEHVTEQWRAAGYSIILGDGPHERFNLSAARNAAVAQSDADIVIVADADTIPDLLALETAVYAAHRHGGVWWPFTEYRYLADTVQPGDALSTAPTEQEYPNSVGGLLVARRSEYWALGGFDERFTEWGGEDRAFELAAAHLSTIHRIPGTVYAFNHTANRDMRGPWRQHLNLYRQAARTGRIAEVIRDNHR